MLTTHMKRHSSPNHMILCQVTDIHMSLSSMVVEPLRVEFVGMVGGQVSESCEAKYLFSTK